MQSPPLRLRAVDKLHTQHSSKVQSIISGGRIYDVPDDANVVSVNAQKRDDGTGDLTVQIIQGCQTVAEWSTIAEYGIAQVSETFF